MKTKYNISTIWLDSARNSWHAWRTRQWDAYPTIRLCCADEALPKFVRQCGVTMEVRQWLSLLDWSVLPTGAASRGRGQTPVPLATYVAAFLVKLDQQKPTLAALHRLLLNHPALVWGLGFPLHLAATSYGFDSAKSVPSRQHLSHVLRHIPNEVLQKLMDSQVKQLQKMLPEEFGQTISIDTKHILAWVKENNRKAYIKEGRYDKTRQLAGDSDCKLGVKRRFNIKTPTKEGQTVKGKGIQLKEFYWGYASGAVVTKVPEKGEFVLAETTRTFNHGDVRYFFPLMRDVIRRLGFRPTYAAADAAYDAFYIYEFFHNPQTNGFAAIPLSKKGGKTRRFNKQGAPLCDADLAMPVKKAYTDKTKAIVPHRRAIHVCPLLFPTPNGRTCPVQHKQWPKGGCTANIPVSVGSRLRVQLERDTDAYKHVFKQRTAVERIFSQAVHLGIERPKLRNANSIANQNTLIYLLINVRAIRRLLDSSPTSHK